MTRDSGTPPGLQPNKGELALSRLEFANRLEHIRRDALSEDWARLPAPPKNLDASCRQRARGFAGYGGRRSVPVKPPLPMFEAEAALIADSYNAYVHAAFQFEHSSEPFSEAPQWLDAKEVDWWIGGPSGGFTFGVGIRERPWGVMRLRKAKPVFRCGCKDPIDVKDIMWGGWEDWS